MATKLVNKGQGIYEVTTSISGKEWQACQDKALKKLVANVQIKGFRKGQAPLELAKEHIDPMDLNNEAINVALPKMFDDCVKEHSLRPFVSPQVKIEKFEKDELGVTFEVTVYPEVTLGAYKDIHLELAKATVSKKEVDETINKLLEDNAELVLKTEAAEKGDTVIFDFKGYVEGKEFEGGSSDNYSLVLGSNTFIPGFEDQLVGVTSETKKDVEVIFPEQYIKDLAGKKAKFACMIHEIKTKKVPTMSDEFVKTLNIKDVTNEAQLVEYEKAQLLAKKAQTNKQVYIESLINEICKNSTVVIADAVIAREAETLKQDMIKQIEQNGLTIEQYKQITGTDDKALEEQFKTRAKGELVTMVVVDKIAQTENLIISRAELDKFYEDTAKMYGMKAEEVKKVYSAQEGQIVSNLMNQKIINFLEANNSPKTTEVKEKKAAK